MVEWLFLVVPLVCLRFVIVVFPDHSQLLYIIIRNIFTMMDLLFVKIDPRHEYSMTFYTIFVNRRKKCALDCYTITNLK